jgi:MYXO-CTERM domain-containing protein
VCLACELPHVDEPAGKVAALHVLSVCWCACAEEGESALRGSGGWALLLLLLLLLLLECARVCLHAAAQLLANKGLPAASITVVRCAGPALC